MNVALTAVAWIDLVSTTILAGVIISAVLIMPSSRSGERATQAAAGLLGATFLVELVLTAWRLSPLAQVGGIAFVGDVLNSRWGRLWLLRVLGLALLARGVRASAPARAVVAVVWLLARSLQGHAGAHGTLPALIDWVHLVAAVTWLGGLLHYLLQRGPIPVPIAGRLRTVSTAALLVLLPAGAYGAFLHVRSLSALLTSSYGRALTGKLGLAAVLVGLGAANHFCYVPAIWREARGAQRRLNRVICLELVIGLFVLLLSALLGVLPMPHGLP
jgi:putative copper export protein